MVSYDWERGTSVLIIIILIIIIRKLSTLSVPDEDYSRNASCTLNLISTFYFYDYSFTSFIIIRKHCCGWMYRVCISKTKNKQNILALNRVCRQHEPVTIDNPVDYSVIEDLFKLQWPLRTKQKIRIKYVFYYIVSEFNFNGWINPTCYM
jgi:hypothetical protein